jgi:hypothetical protein
MYGKLPPVLQEIFGRLEAVFQTHTLRLNDEFNVIYEGLLERERERERVIQN